MNGFRKHKVKFLAKYHLCRKRKPEITRDIQVNVSLDAGILFAKAEPMAYTDSLYHIEVKENCLIILVKPYIKELFPVCTRRKIEFFKISIQQITELLEACNLFGSERRDNAAQIVRHTYQITNSLVDNRNLFILNFIRNIIYTFNQIFKHYIELFYREIFEAVKYALNAITQFNITGQPIIILFQFSVRIVFKRRKLIGFYDLKRHLSQFYVITKQIRISGCSKFI